MASNTTPLPVSREHEPTHAIHYRLPLGGHGQHEPTHANHYRLPLGGAFLGNVTGPRLRNLDHVSTQPAAASEYLIIRRQVRSRAGKR